MTNRDQAIHPACKYHQNGNESTQKIDKTGRTDTKDLREDVQQERDPDRRELRLHEDQSDAETVEDPPRFDEGDRKGRCWAVDERRGDERGEVKLEGRSAVESLDSRRKSREERKE